MAKRTQAARLDAWRKHALAAADVVRANPGLAGAELSQPEVEESTVKARDLQPGDLITASRQRVLDRSLRSDNYVDVTVEDHEGVMSVGKDELVTVERILSDPPTSIVKDLVQRRVKSIAARAGERHG